MVGCHARLGGIIGGRCLDERDGFEMAVERTLGELVRADEEVARDLWGSLANTSWERGAGESVSYSFRAAGDLVAAVRGGGDYLDWYCSGTPGTVTAQIILALSAEGWLPKSAVVSP